MARRVKLFKILALSSETEEIRGRGAREYAGPWHFRNIAKVLHQA